MWTTTLTAVAAPVPVVALGDGVVAMAPAPPVDQTVPGGWVAVLADCLEERSSTQYTVVHRSFVDPSGEGLRHHASQIRDLRPGWVVLTLGARALADASVAPTTVRDTVEALLQELRKGRKNRPEVLLVGLVPPSLDQVEADPPATQAEIDTRTESWNQSLASLADNDDGVALVNPWSDWPRDPRVRAGLTVEAFSLSDQGHARVAAAVCDALLAPTP